MLIKPNNVAKDFLTSCYVREGLAPFLKKLEEDYLVSKKPFSVLIMDVDHFKNFNDRYGHMYGDEVLKYFSSSMRLDLEDEENLPFRFGGDEFIMVFPSKSADEAAELAQRLRKNIHTRSCLIKGRQIKVTFSGGIAAYPKDANSAGELMEKADKALYYAKNHGRDRVMKYHDMAQKEFLQMSLIAAFLLISGWVFYSNRDFLAERIGRVWSIGSRPIEVLPAPLPTPAPPSATSPAQTLPAIATEVPRSTSDAAESALLPDESAEMVENYEVILQSGRTLKGAVVHQDDEVVELRLGFAEGKGIIQIKKSQVLRMRKIS